MVLGSIPVLDFCKEPPVSILKINERIDLVLVPDINGTENPTPGLVLQNNKIWFKS
jgi:hypothetical protein